MSKYYIAYGSNLNIEQMSYRCPNAKVIGTSIIKDYQLLFKDSKSGSYLTIEKCEGSAVPVAVWKVTDEDIINLDRYEGYPTFYYKKEINIEVRGIKTGKLYQHQAFVYIMHEDRTLGVPSKSYVNTCLMGYKAFGFSNIYLARAIKKSMEAK